MKRQYELRKRGEFIVCSATHPDYPNYDERARGRVRHLFDGSGEKYAYPATLCGMLAIGFAQEVMDPERTICGPCQKVAARKSSPDTGEGKRNG